MARLARLARPIFSNPKTLVAEVFGLDNEGKNGKVNILIKNN
jgi:hypothetical protein